VTHLPAVAAAAGAHFEVRKDLAKGRTISSIQRLEGAARTEELTRMLGGESTAARLHAEELLTEGAPARTARRRS
jgi:DNA repair protein RecN (Recombination protein N)